MSGRVSVSRRRLAGSALALLLAAAGGLLGAVAVLPPGPATAPAAASAASAPEPAAPPAAPTRPRPLGPSVYTFGLGPAWRPWRDAPGADPAAVRAEPASAGLEVGLDTRAAPASAVWAAGAWLAEPVPAGRRVAVTLDWRPPANACYRRAGLLLTTAPLGAGRPLAALEPAVWLELVGVPPGRRARRFGATRAEGRTRPLARDGWPADRRGREVGVTTLAIARTAGEVVLTADGVVLGRGPDVLAPGPATLLCYAASQANYPARPVAFTEVRVEGLARAEELR